MKLFGEDVTTEQLQALTDMMDYLGGSDYAYGLFGYAGTGKSTVLSYLSQTEALAYRKTVMSAPTHKAVGVLQNMAQTHDTGFRNFSTVHKLLNMKPKTDYTTGARKFMPTVQRPDGSFDWMAARISKYDVVILDECSMLNREMYSWLTDAARSLNIQIIFVGDPKQLPPVKEENVNGGRSYAFNTPNYSLLKEVKRFSGYIGQVVHNIRKNINADYPYYPRFKQRDDIYRVAGTKDFFEEFMQHHETGQIIGYRNKFVDLANSTVRKKLFGDDVPSFVPGDRVVAKDSSGSWFAQQEFIVDTAYETTHLGMKCWELRLAGQLFGAIHTCDTDQAPTFHKRKKELKNAAQEVAAEYAAAHPDEKDALAKKRKAAWNEFYEFKDAFPRFSPAYAQTIHASQGSTYPQTFILERDINTLKYDPLMHGKMMYVAYSRAAEQIVVV